MIIKKLPGGVIEPDNTRVSINYMPKLRKKVPITIKLSYIYDTDKAKYYRDLLNFYNANFFGYGVFGNPTHFNPTTLSGQQAIELNYDYAKNNMIDFALNLGLGYLGSRFRSIVPKGDAGDLETYRPFIIGDGAESIVIDNSPTTVAKVSLIPIEEMKLRNSIPGTAHAEPIGTMTIEGNEYPVYILNKVKVLDPKELAKYRNKIRLIMNKGRFRKGIQAEDGSEVYYNRNYVVNDVDAGNVGKDKFGNIKIIDFSITPMEEWRESFGPIYGQYKIPGYVY